MASSLALMALINLANERDGQRGIDTYKAIRRMIGAVAVLLAGLVVHLAGSPRPTMWLLVLLAVAVSQVGSDLVLNQAEG